jgi:hypothetical protein
MADHDRLHTLAHACFQAALNVDDTDTAALLLESARILTVYSIRYDVGQLLYAECL